MPAIPSGLNTRIERIMKLAALCLFAIATLSPPAARADDYDLVPTFSTLTLSGHGSVAGTGTVDYRVPPFLRGTGGYEIAGDVTFAPLQAGGDTVAMGGRLQAFRQAGSLTIVSASIRPVLDATSGSPWAGTLAAHLDLRNVSLPGSPFALLAPLLPGQIPSSGAFAVQDVVIGMQGAAPLSADGRFDTAGLQASVTGRLDSNSAAAGDWSSFGQALASGEGRVGGQGDGRLTLPFTVQWHQSLPLAPYAFSSTVDSPLGKATFDVQGGGAVEMDWTLSGTLLAVAAVPEPGTMWMALAGLGLVGLASRHKAYRDSSSVARSSAWDAAGAFTA